MNFKNVLAVIMVIIEPIKAQLRLVITTYLIVAHLKKTSEKQVFNL